MDDLGGVALGTVFGTAIAMTGIVLALAAIITPTRVNIPRSYIVLFAVSPLVMIPFILAGPLTASDGVVLVLLFVAFIGYVASKELRSTTPVFRNAEILEKIEVGGGGAPPVAAAGTDRPTDEPPFAVTVPFDKTRPLPGWAGIALAVVALVGLVAGAAIMSLGTEGILEEYEIGATLFGATIATLVLTIEDVFLTVEPTRRGAPEIGVGNVIGSVVFGVTAKLGIILLAGGSIVVDDDVLSWHLPVLVVMTALSAYFIRTGRLRRWHGFVLLALYIVYWVVSFTDARRGPDRDGLTLADQSVAVVGRAGPSSRSSRYGSLGQASRRTCRGTVRPAYRSSSATAMTSSNGPMTGRNSGIRSIGDSTHSIAIRSAIFARRGTRGSVRSVRMAVTQSGRNPARSFATPGGSRRASTISTSQETTTTATAIRIACSQPGIATPPRRRSPSV